MYYRNQVILFVSEVRSGVPGTRRDFVVLSSDGNVEMTHYSLAKT